MLFLPLSFAGAFASCGQEIPAVRLRRPLLPRCRVPGPPRRLHAEAARRLEAGRSGLPACRFQTRAQNRSRHGDRDDGLEAGWLFHSRFPWVVSSEVALSWGSCSSTRGRPPKAAKKTGAGTHRRASRMAYQSCGRFPTPFPQSRPLRAFIRSFSLFVFSGSQAAT